MAKDPKSLLSDLIFMVMVDGRVKPSEIHFIKKLASRMKISSEEAHKLFQTPKSSKTPYSEVDRITHFYKLMLVMRVDGETVEAELEALMDFSLKMGIRPGVADQIIEKMDSFEDGIVPAEELLNIFKIYYN